MLFHDIIFAAVFFAFYPSAGNAHTRNWVKQWPGEVYSTPGENVSIHCQTQGDIQEAKCLVNWFIKNRHGKYNSIDKIAQFNGRHSEHNQSFTLMSLELNDTGRFYCNYVCRINDKSEQYYGTGTRLFVHFRVENMTEGNPVWPTNTTDGVEDESRIYLFFQFLVLTVLLSKLVVFIFMSCVALFSLH